MQISVLIPTYKRPKLFLEAFHSVLSQTLPPFEILIGDDSPDSATEELVAELVKTSPIPLRYFHHNPRRDQGGNVEFLINHAAGTHICLLHDDDLLEPTALEILAKPFEQYPDLTASYGKPHLINADGSSAHQKIELQRNNAYLRNSQYAGVQNESLIMASIQQFPNDAYLVRASEAKQTGYDHFEEWGEGIDHGFGIRLMSLKNATSFYTDEFVSAYRICEEASSTKPNHCGLYRSFKKVLENTRIPKEHPLILKWARQRVPLALMEAIRLNKLDDAWAWFWGPYFQPYWFSYVGLHRLKWLLCAKFGIHPRR